MGIFSLFQQDITIIDHIFNKISQTEQKAQAP
jgi:hypothetical protein